jgi:hypothetical protein
MSNKPEMKIDANGTKHWYLNGKLHREDGPAVENPDGIKLWYLKGKYHREDGPAIEWTDGEKHWYLNGKLHREDGPAIEWPDGSKHWYLNGNKFSFEDYIQELKLLGKEEVVINLLFQLDSV